MDRIFTVCHSTQLMVVLHLRRHLQLPIAREFLVWHPYENMPLMDNFMREVIAEAGFDDVLDMRDFEGLQPRSQGLLSWWLESARRMRRDAATVRRWLDKNSIVESQAELWADEPIHFHVCFLKGLLRNARHVKFPHCFNHEDFSALPWKSQREEEWRRVSRLKRLVYWPWLKLIAGVDNSSERGLRYDEGYTFDQPTCWAAPSVDVSHLISIQAFRETYQRLPQANKTHTEEILAPIIAAGKPVILLLLFGLTPSTRLVYQQAMSRIFRDRHDQFASSTLAVKPHPGKLGNEEQIFFQWLRGNSPAAVTVIPTPLNVEFLVPYLNFAYVLAGPCGALPIVQRLCPGQAIVLPEIVNLWKDGDRQQFNLVTRLVAGIEAW